MDQETSRNLVEQAHRVCPYSNATCGDNPVELATGIQWEWLPQELGFGSGMTCWRRLRDWNQAGVWQQLQAILLAKLRGANQLDFSRAAIDASHVRALRGGPKPARARSTAPGRARSTT